MRLFVAARPPDGARAGLRRVPRPSVAGVRWLPEERWHVTLRFLGDVDEPAPVVAALGAVPLPAATAVLGPEVVRLGGVAAVPVAGLDALAAAVAAALGPADRPFRGHLTLARGRGRRPVPAALAGLPVPPARWPVGEVEVVRSHLGPDPRYEVLGVVPTA